MRQTVSRVLLVAMCGSAFALSACSEASNPAEHVIEATTDAEMVSTNAADTSVATEGGSAVGSAVADLAQLPAALPKLAYTYDFEWRLPSADVADLQRKHADLCEQQGPSSCQIIGMSTSGEIDDAVRGELQLAVATQHARAFAALLEKEAASSDAEQVSANIEAEELSRKIVDTEARLRARTQLRDRLMEVLRTRRGKVEELVDAERSVARVNEEIDQARSWLREMEGRVDHSRMTIRYRSGAVGVSDFLGPVQGAISSLGTIFGWMLAGLILLIAIAGPIAALVWMGRRLNARYSTKTVAS